MGDEIKEIRKTTGELVATIEALIFVADEPLTVRTMIKILGEDKETVQAAVDSLKAEYDERESGLHVREIGGGWQISTRTQFHEEIQYGHLSLFNDDLRIHTDFP